MRSAAVRDLLASPETDPLVRADVANEKSVFKPQRVKVQGLDGKGVYMDATPSPTGGYTYRPARDNQGEPLRIPPAASDGKTTLQKDAVYISEVLGIPVAEAVNLKLQLKGKAPDEAWANLVQTVAGMEYGRYSKDPERLRQKAAEIWGVARPGEPVPAGAVSRETGSPAPGPRQPGTAQAGEDPGRVSARMRAAAEGYSNLGNWVDGRGFEVYDDAGKLIGYYQ